MTEENDNAYDWTAGQDGLFFIQCLKDYVSRLKNLPPNQQAENDVIARKLLDEISGHDVSGLLSRVLTNEEKGNLVKNEQVSQEFIDSLELKQEPETPETINDPKPSGSFQNPGESASRDSESLLEPSGDKCPDILERTGNQSPSLLESLERIDVKFGLGPAGNRIDTTWGNFGSSQQGSEATFTEETPVLDQNGTEEHVDSDATEIIGMASGDETDIENGQENDPNLGDKNFSDESDVDFSSTPRLIPRTSTQLTPINRVLRQRKTRKSTQLESCSSQSQQSDKDSNFEPDASNISTTTTDESFDSHGKRTPRKRKRLTAPPRSSTPISSTPMTVVDILEDDDDGIPDFEDVDGNTNADKENQINVLHPTQINKKFSENNRQKDDDDEITILTEPNSSTQGIKSHRKCIKTPTKNRKNRSQKTETPDAAAGNEDPVEIIAEPDQPIEIFEDLPTQERKSRKPRPGKESLINHLRSIIGADENITEEEVFKVFELRSTLFSATGYAPEYCICNMHKVKEEQPNQFMFELEWRHEFRGHENPKVVICPRCYTTFSNSGNDEERKTFLKMVHELHLGAPAVFIRSEGPNKRIFEIKSSKKWFKDLKNSSNLNNFQNLKIKNGKIYLELRPCDKSVSKLRKAIGNPGVKMNISVQVSKINGKIHFQLREAKNIQNSAASSSSQFQTSMEDYFSKAPKGPRRKVAT